MYPKPCIGTSKIECTKARVVAIPNAFRMRLPERLSRLRFRCFENHGPVVLKSQKMNIRQGIRVSMPASKSSQSTSLSGWSGRSSGKGVVPTRGMIFSYIPSPCPIQGAFAEAVSVSSASHQRRSEPSISDTGCEVSRFPKCPPATSATERMVMTNAVLTAALRNNPRFMAAVASQSVMPRKNRASPARDVLTMMQISSTSTPGPKMIHQRDWRRKAS